MQVIFQGDNKTKHIELASQSHDWDNDSGLGDFSAQAEYNLP